MKKLSTEDVIGVISGAIGGALAGALVASDDAADMHGVIFYSAYFGFAVLLVQVVAVIIPGSNLAKWIFRIVVLFAVIVTYRLVLL